MGRHSFVTLSDDLNQGELGAGGNSELCILARAHDDAGDDTAWKRQTEKLSRVGIFGMGEVEVLFHVVPPDGRLPICLFGTRKEWT